MLQNPLVLVALAVLCLVNAVRVILRILRPASPLGLLWIGPRLTAAAGWASLGILFASLLVFQRSFTAFSERALALQVTASRVDNGKLEVRYRELGHGEKESTVVLAGDAWAVRGGVVDFNPLLGIIGLKTYHKPIALVGRAQETSSEKRLSGRWLDGFWKLLGWADEHSGLVKTTIKTTDFTSPQPETSFDVYATETAGYTVKRGKR